MSPHNGVATIAQFTPGTSFVEAFGLLAASLLLGNGATGAGHTICVTAGQSGEGTTTMAVNLALTIAGAHRRTLLVDGNFRTPALHRVFGVPPTPGLADILLRTALLPDAVRETNTSDLFVLPAGSVPNSPQTLLQSQSLGTFLEEMRAVYDFVVVDTAPALRFPDSLHVGRSTEGTILVVSAGWAERQAALEVRRRLQRMNVKVLGVVLNRMDPKELTAGTS
jgi:capsular exopolysaccharide synthesis family protein